MEHTFFNLTYYGIDFIALCFTATGLYFIGNKKRYGFAIMMCGSIGWFTIAQLSDTHGLMINSSILFTVNLRNWIKWKPEPEALV